MERIPVCTHYELDGRQTDDFPFPAALERAKPVTEYLEGWGCDISGARSWKELPEAARRYVDYVEETLSCPIRTVSVGPEREAYLIRQR
jgi:adenylosuccinate synthase